MPDTEQTPQAPQETLQPAFIAKAQEVEGLKKALNQASTDLAVLAVGLGVGTMFQDTATGVVYKIVEPNGTFVEYRKIGYDRTALPGESKGSLSRKAAEEAGFTVPKA